MIICGPEQPLVDGLADLAAENDIKVFGPKKSGAIFEGSKIYSKQFMSKYDIPTSDYKIYTDYNSSVFYSDNNIDSLKLNNSKRNNRRGLAIEPQISCMDDLILKKGEKYSHFVNYLFEVKGK